MLSNLISIGLCVGLVGLGAPAWGQESQVSNALLNRVKQDLARQLKISPQRLNVLQATPQTWPDSCLGIPNTQKTCNPLMVVGWRITVGDGQKQWFYRTNETGQLLALENLKQPVPLLPQAIATAVLTAAAAQFNQAPDTLFIAAATPKVWSDGCLGLGGLNLLCTEQLTPGWEITVQSRLEVMPQRWVYRTNQLGTLITWDAAGSQIIGQLITPPARIPPADLPPALTDTQLFRVITMGGLSQRTVTTTLLADGQIMREITDPRGRDQTTRLRQITPEQLALWQELLRQRRFNRFDLYQFGSPTPTTPSSRVFLSNPEATTEFSDLEQYKLPADLMAIFKAWETLIQRGRLPKNVLPDAPLPTQGK